MTQEEALNILKTGANVFLTGEPGAGKTHTINSYVSYLRACGIEPAITASTGIASTHIGGMTIHSWSGIGIRTKLDKYDLDKIASSEYIVKRVGKTRVLIIDEISMLSADMLDMVDAVCREIKQNQEPFGGIQIILVGDFFQLPPISPYGSDGQKPTSGFAYGAAIWNQARLVVCYLSEQHRQDDSDFLALLSGIRANNVLPEHLNNLHSRQIDYEDVPENITKLFSHNSNVDSVNNTELVKLETGTTLFKMIATGNEKLIETLKKGCLSPENLELKIGAVVMCTKNNQKEHFVNGTLGTVIGFSEFSGEPIIKTRTGRSITIAPMDWTVEENGKIRAQIRQIPLRLAWAITVHKSQGMSMDAAVMDLSQVFEFGQGYVALSRVRRLSGIYLLGINDHALKVHPEILGKDIDFKKKSAEAVAFFKKLSSDQIKKMHNNFIAANGGKMRKVNSSRSGAKPKEGNTGKPFAELREKHQNAYRKWTPEEEAGVVSQFKKGKSVKDISAGSGRQVGGIRARLIKLGLIKTE